MTVYYKNVAAKYKISFNIYERNYLDTPNAIGVISCENLCFELPLQAADYFLKRNISHNCGSFL